uniref:Uncharacterized protein n=1 Tax=Panagrolaimus sp. ES5 TaxID=591445 RepID=A0AC34GN46_9BILA
MSSLLIFATKIYFIYGFINYGLCTKLPTAPYNVKLYCRNGRSENLRSMNPSLCPTSSTSCGYFSFPQSQSKYNRNSTEVYECVDSSILLSAEEDYDDRDTNPYYQICNHQPQCMVLNASVLNKQFLNYLVRAHGIRLDSLRTEDVLFCCSLSHSNLARLVKSKLNKLPFSSSLLPVKCNKLRCAKGAIGCLYHETISTNFPLSPQYSSSFDPQTSQEYFDVKPVELSWDDEGDDLIIPPDERNNFQEMAAANTLEINRKEHLVEEFGDGNDHSDEGDYNDGYKCVQMHLNDEVYRYCMMIYAQKSSNRCVEFDGHRICCCFVNPHESTCDPKIHSFDPIPSTSTLPSITASSLSIYPIKVTARTSSTSSRAYTTSTTTTTTTTTTSAPPITVTQRTRCRTVMVTESRQYGNYKTKPRSRKRIVCDDVRPSSSLTSDTTTSESASIATKFSLSFIILSRLLLLSFINI